MEFNLHKTKVKSLPVVCSLEFSFYGEIEPFTVSKIQAFYDTRWLKGDFYSVYFTKASFAFGEESVTTEAGIHYNQELKLRFPSNDENRSIRIAQLQQVRFIKLGLSSGSSALFGRNDYTQNAKPAIKIESTLQLTEVTFTNTSLFPLGFINATE